MTRPPKKPSPPAPPRPPAAPTPLLRLRKRRGLSLAQVAQGAETSAIQVQRLETRQRKMTPEWAERLARALECDPIELMGGGPTLELVHYVRAAGADAGGAVALGERIAAPPILTDAGSCEAAQVVDDSADRLYPVHSLLFVRPLDALARPLRAGDKVLVRAVDTTLGEHARGEGRVTDVLVGILDRSIAGDVTVATRSNNRRVPAVVVVKREAGRGVSERTAQYRAALDALAEVPYRAGADDTAEIVGVVVMAITPE